LWREIARSNQKRGKQADEHGGNQRRMDEQEGQIRAGYGEEVVIKFSKDLTQRFGRGFGPAQVAAMRQFHLTFPLPDNFQSVIGKSTGETSGGSQQPILQSVIEKSSQSAALAPVVQFNRRSSVKFACSLEHLGNIARAFQLSWTHYVRLLRVRNLHAREALAGGWSVRQLGRTRELLER
jgi:hypothetical protein